MKKFPFKDEMLTVPEIAKRLGLSARAVYARARLGQSLEAPPQHGKPQKHYTLDGATKTLVEHMVATGLTRGQVLRRIKGPMRQTPQPSIDISSEECWLRHRRETVFIPLPPQQDLMKVNGGWLFLFEGQWLSKEKLSEQCGISAYVLADRIVQCRWSVERAVTTPVKPTKSKTGGQFQTSTESQGTGGGCHANDLQPEAA